MKDPVSLLPIISRDLVFHVKVLNIRFSAILDTICVHECNSTIFNYVLTQIEFFTFSKQALNEYLEFCNRS